MTFFNFHSWCTPLYTIIYPRVFLLFKSNTSDTIHVFLLFESDCVCDGEQFSRGFFFLQTVLIDSHYDWNPSSNRGLSNVKMNGQLQCGIFDLYLDTKHLQFAFLSNIKHWQTSSNLSLLKKNRRQKATIKFFRDPCTAWLWRISSPLG